jgi:hypothetical protein
MIMHSHRKESAEPHWRIILTGQSQNNRHMSMQEVKLLTKVQYLTLPHRTYLKVPGIIVK